MFVCAVRFDVVIFQVAATAGYNVTIVEVNDQLIEKAQSSIKSSLHRIAKKQFNGNVEEQDKFIAGVFKRLNGSSDLNGVVKQTDLVIEAVVENIKIKHDIFASIDKVCRASLQVSIELILMIRILFALDQFRLHQIIRFLHRIRRHY